MDDLEKTLNELALAMQDHREVLASKGVSKAAPSPRRAVPDDARTALIARLLGQHRGAYRAADRRGDRGQARCRPGVRRTGRARPLGCRARPARPRASRLADADREPDDQRDLPVSRLAAARAPAHVGTGALDRGGPAARRIRRCVCGRPAAPRARKPIASPCWRSRLSSPPASRPRRRRRSSFRRRGPSTCWGPTFHDP